MKVLVISVPLNYDPNRLALQLLLATLCAEGFHIRTDAGAENAGRQFPNPVPRPKHVPHSSIKSIEVS